MRSSYIEKQKINVLGQAGIISGLISYQIEHDNTSLNEVNIDSVLNKVINKVEGRILVVNNQNNVIFDSFNELRGSVIEQKEVTKALSGDEIVNEYILKEYKNTLYAGSPILKQNDVTGAVIISVSLIDYYEVIDLIRNRLLIISISILIIIAFISITIATRISEPIQQLTSAMQKAAHGKLNEKVNIEGDDEISQLAKAYNFMNTKLSHIEKQRKEFVANVSHELKTPLSSIKLLSGSLLYQPNASIDIYNEFLKDIDSEVDRLNKIIESLLSMVDLDEQKLTLDYRLTYVNYLLERIVNSAKPLADDKNIKIVLNQLDKIQIYLDQDKIYQALTNIIYNAIKYTEDYGKVEVSLFRRGQYAVIKISDSGIGIPEESIPYIFERFYRVDSARSRQTGGSGLGLSISEQIISLHQGSIEIESTLNIGTTFYVKIPMNYTLGEKA